MLRKDVELYPKTAIFKQLQTHFKAKYEKGVERCSHTFPPHYAQETFITCKTRINLASVGYLFQITAESLVNHLVGKIVLQRVRLDGFFTIMSVQSMLQCAHF